MSGMNSTNRNHRALAQPDRSRLRKMSMKIQIRIQIQITHKKISKIVQNTFNNGYDEAASGISPPFAAGRPLAIAPGRLLAIRRRASAPRTGSAFAQKGIIGITQHG